MCHLHYCIIASQVMLRKFAMQTYSKILHRMKSFLCDDMQIDATQCYANIFTQQSDQVQIEPSSEHLACDLKTIRL